MDVIRRLADQRHFFTAQMTLADYGQVLLIGDEAAVERLAAVVAEHEEHDLVDQLSERAHQLGEEPPAG
jgi:hypothetical protein